MGRGVVDVDRELAQRVEALGFELVSVDWAGSRNRPVLRLRVDRPDAAVGEGVTADDCATVSRGLEPWLDGMAAMPERYVLEVSSPGVERPLVRPRDWDRFKGEEVVVKGHEVLADRATRLEAELLGLVEGDEPAARLRLQDGKEVTVRLSDIKAAHLLFRWR
jgi:ribosome maturation factor RimP